MCHFTNLVYYLHFQIFLLVEIVKQPCFLHFNTFLFIYFSFASSIQYKTSKEGSTMGITVSHSTMLAHCQALTQACGYTEGEEDSAYYELLVLYHLFITVTWIF